MSARRKVKAGVSRYTVDNDGKSYTQVSEWILPRTPEDYDAMVEQMAKAICLDAGLHEMTKKMAKAALRAIGIKKPSK